MDVIKQLAEKASQLTTNPGVYLMKDRQGSVIYVGKAKVLRNRVRSYFQAAADPSPKTRLMVSKISDFDTIVTPTEKDALILENTLIKKYRPRYNVVFRDDKEYPYLRLAAAERYPNLTIVRKPRKDGARYFGPFASAQSVRETLKVVNRLFPLRKCKRKRLEQGRPCIYHQLGQCPAPCALKVDPAAYAATVRQVELFLRGRSSQVVDELQAQMAEASAQLQFERAAQLRDRMRAVEQTLEKQLMVCLDFADRDVFACFREANLLVVTMLFVRGGRTTGSRNVLLRNVRITDQEALSSFVAQYYQQQAFIPDEVLLPFSGDDNAVLEQWLKDLKQGVTRVVTPQRGAKRELLDMAAKNAGIALQKRLAEEQGDVLEELQQRLHLPHYPFRIACFDISNIMGTHAVGAMVLFEDGVPQKAGYRKFKIRTVGQADDYGMMLEVLQRYLGLLRQDELRPDLIVVDGGRGQLAVLCRVLQEMEFDRIAAAAIAKGPERERAKREQEEKLFIPGRKNPLPFPQNSPALFLLQRIRDEAHRFAVGYHHQVKKKNDFTSELESIPGVGPKTVQAVLKHFGSLERVRAASCEQLAEAPSVNAARAQVIYDHLHNAGSSTG